jgi:hypothetical protein
MEDLGLYGRIILTFSVLPFKSQAPVVAEALQIKCPPWDSFPVQTKGMYI